VRSRPLVITNAAWQHSLPNIFNLFFTTKAVGQGAGLGLPISGRIVEGHDGWIEAANGDESGAVFTIYPPQAHPIEVRAEAMPARQVFRWSFFTGY
jgi:K+-sensing histidine kinase KdpD